MKRKVLYVIIVGLTFCCSARDVDASELEQKINCSISDFLPEGASWKLSIPTFMHNKSLNTDDIQVSLPISSNLGSLVAQVWLKEEGELKLYAVPVEVLSLSD